MAETKEKATAKTAVAKTQTTALSVNAGISNEEAAKILQEAEVGELDSSYLALEAGESRKVIYMGIEPIDGMGDKAGQKVDAIKLKVLSSDGVTMREQINADAVVVSYFTKQQVGIARQITCTGEQKSKSGFMYKTFDFNIINAKK